MLLLLLLLFKASNNSTHNETSSDDSPTSSPSMPSTPSATHSLQSSSYQSSKPSINAVFNGLQTLRSQNTALLSMLENLPYLVTSCHLPTHVEARESSESDAPPTPRVSALQRIVTPQLSPAYGGLTPRSPRSVRSRSSFAPHLRPMSLHTVGSTGDSIFFDAEDGGLEFVDMDRTMTSTQSDSDDEEFDDEARAAAQFITGAAISVEHGIVDGERGGASTPVNTRPPELALDTSEMSKLCSSISQVSSSSTVSIRLPSLEVATPVAKTAVVRRARLPTPTSGEQLSLFTMLKRNIGKVSSKINLRSSHIIACLAGSLYCRVPCYF